MLLRYAFAPCHGINHLRSMKHEGFEIVLGWFCFRNIVDWLIYTPICGSINRDLAPTSNRVLYVIRSHQSHAGISQQKSPNNNPQHQHTRKQFFFGGYRTGTTALEVAMTFRATLKTTAGESAIRQGGQA